MKLVLVCLMAMIVLAQCERKRTFYTTEEIVKHLRALDYPTNRIIVCTAIPDKDSVRSTYIIHDLLDSSCMCGSPDIHGNAILHKSIYSLLQNKIP